MHKMKTIGVSPVRPIARRPLWGANASRRALTLLAVTWLASGCAHNVLYDENRDKQGQEVKKAVAEARLADAVTALEKTFNELAAREEANAKSRAVYSFELELRIAARAPSLTSRFADGSTDGLQTVVQARLDTLSISKATDEDLKRLRKLNVQMTAKAEALEQSVDEVRGSIGHRFDSCADVYATSANPKQKDKSPAPAFVATFPADKRAEVRLKFENLIRQCKEIDEITAARNQVLSAGGLVKTLSDRVDQVERDIAAYGVETENAREQLKSASKTFRDSGVEGAAKPGPSKLKTLEERAASLREAVKAVAAANSAGAHIVAEDKLNSLETILGAVAGTSDESKVVLNADEQVAVAIVRDLPSLADEADKLLKEAKKPRLVPFLAAIDYQKLVVQSFEEARRAKRKQADATRKQLEAARNEAMALVRVLDSLQTHPVWAAQSITKLDGSLSGKEKSELYRALATYADDVQQFRVEAAMWGARAQAAEYEEGLVRSKFAAAEWDGLIDTMATVLADYHAAGIKNADLAEFFKALGLVAIGIGVAQ